MTSLRCVTMVVIGQILGLGCADAMGSRSASNAPRTQQNERSGASAARGERSEDSAANRVNRRIVGNATQDANEAAAANPKGAEGRGAGQPPQGAGQSRPPNAEREGRTSMQPGEPSGPPATIEQRAQEVLPAEQPGRFSPFAVEFNPIGLFIGGRLSFGFEWVPVVHHAFSISPHFVHTTADISTSVGTESQSFTGVGTELGYRYYTGHRGMNGLFIGPSLIVGAYNASLPTGNTVFEDVGLAGDIGYQEIFWDHLVVGGGAGLEYLHVTQNFRDLPTGPSIIASTGFKPRLLLQAGFAF